MADNFIANPGAGGDTFAADDVGGVKVPYSKLDIGGDGVSSPVTASNPMPVAATSLPLPAGAATEATLLAMNTKVPSLGQATMANSQPVTIASNQSNVPTSNNATIFAFSTQNSSVVQLAAGATFPGAIETALDQPAISLLMTSDQAMTLTVRQFIDLAGTRAAPDIVFTIDANAGFSRSFPLNGNYVQVLATNNGASTTTTFNLNTAYGNLIPADSTGALPIAELPLIITGAAAQTAVVNNILPPVSGASGSDLGSYRTASVQVVSTGTGGTFIFEQSNDGTNWSPLPVFNAALTTGVAIVAAITATASAIIYTFPIRARFVRLRIATTITGGSIRAFSRMSTEPWTAAAQLVANPTAANFQVDTEFAAAAALADGAANPTTASGGALQSMFNGTTWDRVRNNVSINVDTSAARTASGNGATFTNHNGESVAFWISVTAVSGTTPTMTVRVQWSPDNGTTWLDIDTTNLQTASITATTNATLRLGVGLPVAANASANTLAPRLLRLAWTIGGTTPSFTFATWANTGQ
jgi:hypothetical protein